MGIFKRKDSPYWWYRVQIDGKVQTGTTNATDRKLAAKIALDKRHQLVEGQHFPSLRGNRLKDDGAVRTVFDALVKAANLGELTFHDLRHNFASELVMKGADLRTVQEYLGHSTLMMVQRYAHVSEGIRRSTIQLLSREPQIADKAAAELQAA